VTVLLDASVLIPLQVGDHTHREAARTWFLRVDDSFATCPITQGALVRYLIRFEQTATDALRVVGMLEASPRHQFWPDSISFGAVNGSGLLGHRQVTDCYLAELARHNHGRVATFDQGFAALHADVAELVPSS
jgi:uncharacterized protein